MIEGKNIIVTLGEVEHHLGALLAGKRWSESRKMGLKANGPGWGSNSDLVGALCEIAYAKAVNVYFLPTYNTFKAPDVGSIQVRGTTHKNGKLIFRPNDKLDEVFVLVISNSPDYKVVGWMKGQDIHNLAQKSNFGSSKKPLAFYATQGQLRPFPIKT